MMKRPIAIAAACCAGLIFAGCSVPKNLVWLPDSSGFVYVKNDGTVMRFDVKDAKPREIVKAKSAAPQDVALSPDGKRFAIVDVAAGDAEDTVSVSIYSAAGKLLSTSKTLSVAAGERKKPPESSVHWSPDKTHILVSFTTAKGDMQSAVCDAKTGTLTLLAVKPSYLMDYLFSLPPIRPDGKGYLAEKERTGSELLFVEWNGTSHELAEEESFKAYKKTSSLKSMPGESELAGMKRQGFLPIPVGRWEKHVAIVPIKGGEVRVDTEKKRVSYHTVPAIAKRYDELSKDNILLEQPLAGGRYRVRVKLFDRMPGDRDKNAMQFELYDVKAKTSATLTGLVNGLPGRMLFPSPDRKHVAILYTEGKLDGMTRPDYIVRVIRADGKVVSTFDVK